DHVLAVGPAFSAGYAPYRGRDRSEIAGRDRAIESMLAHPSGHVGPIRGFLRGPRLPMIHPPPARRGEPLTHHRVEGHRPGIEVAHTGRWRREGFVGQPLEQVTHRDPGS